jgi:hypothetical protein
VTGIVVGFLIFGSALFFMHRHKISPLDILLLRPLRRRLAPEKPPLDQVAETPRHIYYLPTPSEDVIYLNKSNERRRGRRFWGNPIEVRIMAHFRPEPVRGAVVNRSTTGVALLVDDSYEAGTVIKLRAVLAPKDVDWIDVEIKNCRRAGRNWVIGCQFPDPPPWKAVAWLG